MAATDNWAAQLGRNAIFGTLSDDGRQRLAAAGTPLKLAHGARLFSTGEPGDAAFLLLTGELEVGLSRADGGETWLAQLGPGAVIGDMAVLDGGVRSADVSATRTSQLLRLSRAAVLEALTTEPQAALRLLALLVDRLRAANALVEASTALDLGARLARVLLKAERREIRSQSELARIAGGTRESINRKLSSWRTAGWVDVGPRGIEVTDRSALLNVAQLDDSGGA